eukprot:TRINITY_DN3649_c0_g1_i1.p1 TRINITY_DN3649_c0_g1~~TRINITY_DN3649_c0_g1_i1.p1  ORF type:complete len:754 (+),score=174.38 TRINITY_DN3649_c0_g1_i1:386-2647(+)
MKRVLSLLLLVLIVVNAVPFAKVSKKRFQGRTAREIRSDWDDAKIRAAQFVSQLTLQEKVSLTTGVGWENGPCLGNTPPIPRMNFSGLCLQDSPTGVRFADFASAFPAAINLAQTWDRDIIFANGEAMGSEHRGKGVNIDLAPMANLGRVAAGGRNWEGWGADPYLTGEGSAQTVLGIQSTGVIACAKHYIANEQEHFRTSSSSNMDDRTLHELYAYPFLQMVLAGVGSFMCSYNQLNGTYACENDRTLNQILKKEFGYQSFVMSDWSATMSGVKSVLAGLDMTMPGDIAFNSNNSYFGQNLTIAVQNGSVSQARLDDMGTRILTPWYFLGQDEGYPATNLDWVHPEKSGKVHVGADHYKLIRQIGAQSIVLLKNNNRILPLSSKITGDGLTSLGVIGSDAGPWTKGPNECEDHGCDNGTLAQGWGSGTSTFPYLITPLAALQEAAEVNGLSLSFTLSDWDIATAKDVASKADVAIVFSNCDSGEGYITVDGNEGDRNNLTLWHNGDVLIQAVASVNPNTIVVLHTVGPVIMPWADNPNIKAIVYAGLPGQESGNGLVDVLFGAVNPGGKLVYTIAKKASDYPAAVVYKETPPITQIPYNEGLFIDYRWFDAKSIVPQYEFGFGLSYTTFAYYGLTVTKYPGLKPGPVNVTDDFVGLEVTFTIQNNGTVDGAEVAQIYLSYPQNLGEPPKVLRGFDKYIIAAGDSTPAIFYLTEFDLSVWNTGNQVWNIASGPYQIQVGSSSRDIRLSAGFTI